MRKIDVWPLLLPEMQAACRKSQELYAGLTGLPEMPVPRMRRAYETERHYWNAFPAEVAQREDLVAPTDQGPVALRLYHPAPGERRPLLLYLHGGGWMLGSLDTHDRILRLHARESGWAVLGIDYPLAPETKFPRQIHQIAAIVRGLPELLGGFAVEADRFAFAGDSAGANIAFGTTLALREAGGPLPRALLLHHGAFGLKDSASRRLYGNTLDGLREQEINLYQQAYRRRPEDADHPWNNAFTAELEGLPPSFFGVVALDPLRDDSLALEALLRAVGVPTALKLYDGVLHGFLHYSATVPLALEAIRDGCAFLDQPLDVESGRRSG